jgi:hypothetical protein
MKYGAQDGSMGPTSGTRLYARPDIKFCTTSALPIELSYFKPYYDGDVVKLEWSTFSEHNNDYFTVEKSLDGINYETLPKIKGAGTTTNIRNYYQEDRDVSNSLIYYRLKQTDYDGNFERTEWYTVNLEDYKKDLYTYPNPIKDELNIVYESDGDKNTLVSIQDLSGKIVFEELVDLKYGQNNVRLDLPEMGKGFYVLNFDNNLIKIEH